MLTALFEDQPTQREVMRAVNDLLRETSAVILKGSFLDYTEKYIKSKEDVLSASTIRGYRATMRGLPDSVILKLGGWKSDNVMKNIYRKALKEDLHRESEKFLSHMTEIS